MPDVRELGRKVKAKYPGKYDDLDDGDVGRRVKAKYPGAYDDFTDAPAAQPTPAPAPGGFQPGITGFAKPVMEAVSVGAERTGVRAADIGLAIYETLQGMKRGDVEPLLENLELAGRGALKTIAGFSPLGAGAVAAQQDPAIAAVKQRQAERRSKADEGFNELAAARQALDVRAGKDPSLAGKIIRRGTETLLTAAPSVAAGVASGGSIPVMATVGALQSAGQPENLALNVALEATPLPVAEAFKAGINTVRRTFGKGAAQIIEAEVAPAVAPRIAPQFLQEGIPPAPVVDPLQSTFSKLGTDNVEQIGAMFANANRRLNKKITPEQRASAVADYKALQQLTREEHDALSQVLPGRQFHPAEREIMDIPASERNAQLDANLREAEEFFETEGQRLTAPITAPSSRITTGAGAELPRGTYRAPEGQPIELPQVATEAPTGLNETARARLLDDAGRQRDLSHKYYRGKASALPSVNDPIDGEIARLRSQFFERAAAGENPDAILVDIDAQARKAAETFNARQQQLHGKAQKKDWRTGVAGFMSPDEASTRIRHTYNMTKLIIEKAQPAPRIAAETGLPAASAAAPAPAPSVIGDRIRTMARTPTSPVSVGEVRRQFPGVGKKEFDDEMIRLVEDGEIALHRHDAPGQLTAAERDAMVKIGKDYYTAATVRGPSASAPLDALTVAPAGPGGTMLPPPPVDIPTGFGDLPPGPQAHLFDFAPSLSRLSNIWQRTKDELFGALGATKSLKSSLDISYPFRQGALLLLRPLQWRQAAKTWQSAFRGFRTKNFDEIKQAIELHPLAKRMEESGLYRGMISGEEAFPGRAGSRVSEVVGKTPGIKQSQQAFTAAADTQRVQAFEQYARAIDRAELSTAEALKADKAAAEWINIATGRGSLGQKADRALEGLNFFFFSPRYIASRLNVLNPVMYARNLASPGGRVVLRRQMADLAQFTGVVATTLYLAKQAGADVGLNPESPDFLKIRFGNHRYDMLAGLQQVMRAGYRISADIARAARGEKPKFGESAIDIGETFLSYKLAPPASAFRSFINQRTPGGKDFTAARAAADLVAPIQWADFVDAWRDESFGAALKTLPGAVGIGANRYEFDPVEAALDRNRPLLSELQRLKIRVAELQRKKDKDGNPEPDDAFNARVQQFGQNYTSYGLQLIQHPRFQIAPDDVKTRALRRLNEKAKGLTHKEFGFPELELDPELILDSVEK